MKSINLLAIGFSTIAIGCFLADGIVGDEPVWIAGNCALIGVNYALWKSK